ncbi:hypothetical protein H7J71_23070 [Mycolicibacterium peregrinum]|uniref:hypothetical protein n=1 Tax=Mycolicibacterium peregrinum TaxID=43304 RepID=UPI0006D7EFCE|nr:hypothetical protein [Mycolicibacterium peregrinum]MCV7204900.1 hypothetical protein [Mycolicibacterium peregrinum]ORW59520.1 hypothetical protein AWC21_12465 [Mycolicibacterium peregrinum]
MSTDYRDAITNLHRGVHCDVNSARTRLQGVIELMEQANLTAAVADLRAVEQRLAEAVRR